MWTGSQWRDHELYKNVLLQACPTVPPASVHSFLSTFRWDIHIHPACEMKRWCIRKPHHHISTIYSTIFYPLSDDYFWGVFCCQASPNGKFRTCKSIFKVPLWPWLSQPYPNHIRTKWLEDLEFGSPNSRPSPWLQDYKTPVYFG